MTFRKLVKILIGLLLIFAVFAGLTSINHPIVLKWLSGTARMIGKPLNATVYTNGQINHSIKVFHVDKYWEGGSADYYILYTPYADNTKLKFFSINRKDKYVGRPSGTNICDYDYITGFLFQSEVGGHFTPFEDDMKGYNFDPQLSFSDRQIKLNIPPTAKELKCDSIRIEL
jgi:hypothetical protein